MKLLSHLISIIILVFAFQQIIPQWWIACIVPGLVCFFSRPGGGPAFLFSFLALFILWSGQALLTDIQNDFRLSQGIAELLLKSKSHYLIVIITGIIGGISAGLGGLSGYLAFKLIDKK